MKDDSTPRMIGDYKDENDVGPFVQGDEEDNSWAMTFTECFLAAGKWEESRCKCSVYCHVCKNEHSNVDYIGYGLHIRHGYSHYVRDHRVVIDKELAKLAEQFMKGEID